MRYVLPFGHDGKNAMISPNGEWVSLGHQYASLLRVATGEVLTLFGGAKARQLGWWEHPLRLIVARYEDDCDVVAYEVATGIETIIAAHQNISLGEAGGGHWSSGYADGMGRVIWDGFTLTNGLDWYVGGDGDWAVCADEHTGKAHVWLRGVKQHAVPYPSGLVHGRPHVRDSMCGVGHNGRAFVLSCSSGEFTDVTVSPTGKESTPRWSLGLIATAIEGPDVPVGQVRPGFVAIRPAGAEDVIVVDVAEGCVGCDFRVFGSQGIVVTWNNANRATVITDIDLTQPRAKLPPLPVVPPDPPPMVTLTLRPMTGTAPLNVEATLWASPGSGPITAVRWRVNGALDGGNDSYTHTFELSLPGTYGVSATAGGPGGRCDTPPQAVTVTAPVVVVPPPVPTFTLGLNAGFGFPLPDARLAAMLTAGVQVVRAGIGLTDAIAAVVVAQFARFPQIVPLYVIRATPGAIAELARVPDGSTVELGNEPNIGDSHVGAARMTPTQYATWASGLRSIITAKRLTAYWGCPSSCSPDGLAWLKGVLTLCPWMERVSVHRYSNRADCDPMTSPWGGRPEELRQLQAILGGRRFRVTEAGCKCGPQAYRSGWWIFKTWREITQARQLDVLRWDIAWWRAVPGCDGVDVYQECSGPGDPWGLNDEQGRPRLAWAIFTT